MNAKAYLLILIFLGQSSLSFAQVGDYKGKPTVSFRGPDPRVPDFVPTTPQAPRADPEKCEKTGGAPSPDGAAVPVSTQAELGTLEKATQDFAFDDVYDLLGQCKDPDGDHDIAERKIIPELRKAFRSPGEAMGRRKTDADYLEKLPGIRKDDGKMATEEDWIAVDLVARTLYQEVATKGAKACGDEYLKMIGRIILNRVEDLKKGPATTEKFTKGKDQTLPNAHPAVWVVLARKQFAVWRGNNNSNKWLACPAKNHRQTYSKKFGTLKVKATKRAPAKEVPISSGSESQANWERSVRTAAEMIFRENKFRKGTDSFTYRFHTTGKPEHKNYLDQCYQSVPGATVSGKPVNDLNCAEAWIEPTPAQVKFRKNEKRCPKPGET